MKLTFLSKAAVCVLLGLSAGCGIPNVQPFRDATTELATQLRLGFERTQVAMRAAAELADDQSAFRAAVKKLDETWTPTRKAVAGLVEYSDALAGLVEAGNKGKATVGRLTDAVSQLSTAVVGLPLPAAAASVVQAVGAKIIEMKAERDIKKAVAKAAEAVDLMAPLLRDNLTDLGRIHAAAANVWLARTQGESAVLVDYYETLVGEERRLQSLLTLIVQYQSAPERLLAKGAAAVRADQNDNLKVLKDKDTVFQKLDLSGEDAAFKIEARQKQLMDLINAHRKEVAVLDAKYNQAVAGLNQIREARQQGAMVMANGAEAITAWQKAHQSLRAVAEGQQSRPSVAELVAIVRELAAIAK